MVGKSTKMQMSTGDCVAATAEMTAFWKVGNMEGIKSMLCDDVVCIGASADKSDTVPFFGTFHGHNGFDAMMGGMMSAVEFKTGMEFCDCAAEGNVVVRFVKFEMTVKLTGQTIEGVEMQRFEWNCEQRKMAKMQVFADTAKICQAFMVGGTFTTAAPAMPAASANGCATSALTAAAEMTAFWKLGNMEGMLAHCADSIVSVGQSSDKNTIVPFFGTFHGHDGWKEMMAGFGPEHVEFKNIEFSEHMAVSGSTVVRIVHAEMKFINSGVIIGNTEMHRFDFDENHKCIRFQLFSDSDKIMKAMAPRIPVADAAAKKGKAVCASQ